MGVDCCGITGTYGYKHEKYDIAQRVGQLLDKLRSQPGHLRQRDLPLEHRRSSGLEVIHTLQVLAEGVWGWERVRLRAFIIGAGAVGSLIGAPACAGRG